MARLVDGTMQRSLRAAFARVEWVGPMPDVPADHSVVMIANHPSFYDGYLGWLVAERVLNRRVLTWMQEWDRFPFFAASGALPFPADDPAGRAATVRRTARLFGRPDYALLYFPEGRLRTPEEGVGPFDERLLSRLDRILPPRTYLPLAIHLTWDGGARPLVRLAAGSPVPTLQGDERARLIALLDTLRYPQNPPLPATTLLDGATSPADRWDFRFARAYFRRYL